MGLLVGSEGRLGLKSCLLPLGCKVSKELWWWGPRGELQVNQT